jgi:hypothetical protein
VEVFLFPLRREYVLLHGHIRIPDCPSAGVFTRTGNAVRVIIVPVTQHRIKTGCVLSVRKGLWIRKSYIVAETPASPYAEELRAARRD